MKRLFLLLLLILVVGAWTGQLMVRDPGYVLLAFEQTTVETSLWVFIVATLLLFLVLHGVINLLSGIRLPELGWGQWRLKRKRKAAERSTLRGLLALSEGNWQKAQKDLIASTQHAAIPFINQTAATKAAMEQGDFDTAEKLIQQARRQTPHAKLALDILAIELDIARGELRSALSTLVALRRQHSQHKTLLSLQLGIYERLQDWQGILDLLPELKRQNLLDNARWEALAEQATITQLHQQIDPKAGLTAEVQRKQLQSFWQSLPEAARDLDPVVAAYVEQLLNQAGDKLAEPLLKERLNRRWSDVLAGLYGRIQGDKAQKRYEQAQAWLVEQEQSPELHLSLARLAQQLQNWDQACLHFESALTLKAELAWMAEYARLLQHLGQQDKANLWLNRSFEQVAILAPKLPMPEPALSSPS